MSLSSRFPPNVLPSASFQLPTIETLSDIFLSTPTDPSKLAVVIPDGGPHLSYAQMQQIIVQISSTLLSSNDHFQRGDSICISLPNGLEFISAFFAVASIRCVAAPLNPSYTVEENKFYLEDIKAKAMIIPKTGAEAAKKAAVEIGASVYEISWDSQHNTVSLNRIISGRHATGHPISIAKGKPFPIALPSDVALVLHTSGTTSRPKAVPLSHANIVATVLNIVGTLYLSSSDRSLVVMPLFHVHGLIGAAFSSLAAGSSIVIPPKFSARSFWQHFNEHHCTWYSAVPTIHQILLENEKTATTGTAAKLGKGKLRFIRSCSSQLAPSTYKQMNDAFGVPVVEAYAMTEAAHQMTCNPLPIPAVYQKHVRTHSPVLKLPRKAGSVGLAHGSVEVAILDSSDKQLGKNQKGEICVRGKNVTSGYINNPEANASSFTKAEKWFRTGDEGYLDEEGYLFLTGRIKELINRGGEKISPLEVDEALLSSPLVAQAVSFPAPHTMYGQEVYAAVVLKQSFKELKKTEKEVEKLLQEHAKTKMAPFKIPKKIYFGEDLPKTATGKIQRRHVAAHFLKDEQNKEKIPAKL